ncbi:4'-phosphopantetheinyl transferase family protein [Plantibacter sp. YIM 135249]|jgi:4'-phosphopantetheinyl transferase|uniref:4'-phosphopantetheinyl transferase family protein n=1 Tax=Plantibacter sp. YIM 135249 TaxID=3423918 RepID=UPI003D355037
MASDAPNDSARSAPSVSLRWVDPRDDVFDEGLAVLALSDAEHARLASTSDRRRFLLGRALLRATAAELLGVEPAAVRISAACPDCGREHGKPEATTEDGRRVHLSLSHSPVATAATASLDGAVGIDVEQLDASRFAGVEDVALSAAEREDWLTLPEEDRIGALAHFWTRKEAVVKALGPGLRLDPATIEVTTPGRDGDEPRVLRVPGVDAATITLQDIGLAEGLAVSIAVVAPLAPPS